MNIYTKSFRILSIRGSSCNSNLNILYFSGCCSDVWNTLRVVLWFNERKDKWILFSCLFKIFSSDLRIICLINYYFSGRRCWSALTACSLRFRWSLNWGGNLFRSRYLSLLNFNWLWFRWLGLLFFNNCFYWLCFRWLNLLFFHGRCYFFNILGFFCYWLLFFGYLRCRLYFFYIFLLCFIFNNWNNRFLLFRNIFIFALIVNWFNDSLCLWFYILCGLRFNGCWFILFNLLYKFRFLLFFLLKFISILLIMPGLSFFWTGIFSIIFSGLISSIFSVESFWNNWFFFQIYLSSSDD